MSPATTASSPYRAARRGSPTRIAARADIWLQLRPGTDTALALGMLNVIVNEKLYDRKFVENHVYGWEQFVM